MLNDITRRIIETSNLLNLDEVLIEKDYYITQVIHTLSNIENDFFQLVFSGGTCLVKAHKIVNRMSEDIDFKIHRKSSSSNFNKTKLRKELKTFREQINETLLKIPTLISQPPLVRSEGKYSRIEISYPLLSLQKLLSSATANNSKINILNMPTIQKPKSTDL